MRRILVFLLLLCGSCAMAAQSVLVWGGDLASGQKEQVREELLSLGADLTDAKELTVTNQEERQALKGKVAPQAIGTRAISSVYIKVGAGRGIAVRTSKITLLTEQMYRSALVTGGVKQAEVIALAPVPVSGTAALTGIFKAYEFITGEELPAEAKDAATEELVQSGELGQRIGQKKAAQLIDHIKTRVLKEKPADIAQVEDIIKDAAQNMNVSLSQAQLAKLGKLFFRISKLPLDLSQVQQLLSGGIWQKVSMWFVQLGSLLGGLLKQLLALFV